MTLLHSPGDPCPEPLPEHRPGQGHRASAQPPHSAPGFVRPPTVRHALRALEAVAGGHGGVDEARLAARTGLPPARLAGLLRTLLREGYVERLGDGSYVAGRELALLGGAGAGGRERALRERLRRTLARLRDSIGAAVYLGRYRDGEVEIVGYADGPRHPAPRERPDFRLAGHATALGKCLLGQLDHDARRDHLSRHRAVRLTPRTITDERVLLSVLERHPPTVPVLDLQEYAVGSVCAAVPVTAGSAVGSLGVCLPVEETHRLRRAAEALSEQAAGVLLPLSL